MGAPYCQGRLFLRLNYLSRAVMGAGVDVDVIVPNVLRRMRTRQPPLATRCRIGDDRFFRRPDGRPDRSHTFAVRLGR